jgi:hypothetical protein
MAVEMGREYVVFCLDMLEYGREGKFGYFLHEADYLLLSLAEHAPKMPAKAGKSGATGRPRRPCRGLMSATCQQPRRHRAVFGEQASPFVL